MSRDIGKSSYREPRDKGWNSKEVFSSEGASTPVNTFISRTCDWGGWCSKHSVTAFYVMRASKAQQSQLEAAGMVLQGLLVAQALPVIKLSGPGSFYQSHFHL